MDRNVKIAKQLVKLAKSLIAEDELNAEEGALDNTITVGSVRNAEEGALDNTIVVGSVKTAWDRYVETDKEREVREERERPRGASEIVSELLDKARDNMFRKCKTGIALNTVYVDRNMSGKSEYGKVTASMVPQVKQDGTDVIIEINSFVKNAESSSWKPELFDSSKITLKRGDYCVLEAADNYITIKSRKWQNEGVDEFIDIAYEKLVRGLNSASGTKLKDKLYKMNTPFIKRLFGIGK